MPDIVYTWKGNLPYHASHKINGTWMDICLGSGDTIMLPDNAEENPAIKNLVKSGFLQSKDQPPVKKNKPGKKTEEPKPANTNEKEETEPSTDNNSKT